MLSCNAQREEINTLFDSLCDIITFSKKQPYIAAELSIYTKQYDLSLADKACIALAIDTGTADRIWKELKLENVDIHLIR